MAIFSCLLGVKPGGADFELRKFELKRVSILISGMSLC